jgi:hypothetical protein
VNLRALVLLPLLCLPALAGERPAVTVTVYNAPREGTEPPPFAWLGTEHVPQGFALVREARKVDLPTRRCEVRVAGVPARIVPSTVTVRSRTDPEGTVVLSQAYVYDLATTFALLRRHLGRTVTVVGDGGRVTGRLLWSGGGNLPREVALRVEGEREPVRIRGFREVRFEDLPGGLVTRPTLVLEVETREPGPHVLEISYLADGITWRGDYLLFVDAEETKLDLAGWATVENECGAGFEDARLKLMGGDVHRIQEPTWEPTARFGFDASESVALNYIMKPFEEKAFFEYHLYTLGRPTTIRDRSRKQIELFPSAHGVSFRKVYVYDGGPPEEPGQARYEPALSPDFGVGTDPTVEVQLELENRLENGLGLPLPAGRVRIYRTDPTDGAAEFIGEDEVDHTPRDETVRLRLGRAFDVRGARRSTAFEVSHEEHWITESFEIRVRNRKNVPVRVLVREHLRRWVNWRIETEQEHLKLDATTVEFPVDVPAGAESVVKYTVRYEW